MLDTLGNGGSRHCVAAVAHMAVCQYTKIMLSVNITVEHAMLCYFDMCSDGAGVNPGSRGERSTGRSCLALLQRLIVLQPAQNVREWCLTAKVHRHTAPM